MKECIIETAKVLCSKCGIRYGFDVQTQQEGFRTTTCPLCKHEQIVYIVFRSIVVPVGINPSKRT